MYKGLPTKHCAAEGHRREGELGSEYSDCPFLCLLLSCLGFLLTTLNRRQNTGAWVCCPWARSRVKNQSGAHGK